MIGHLMLNYKNCRVRLLILLIIMVFVSCENRSYSYKDVQISAAPYIKADDLNIKDFVTGIKSDPSGMYSLHIVIYSYSPGRETVSMTGENEFTTEKDSAKLRAIVKVIDGDRIVEAGFIEVSGSSSGELLLNLAKSVKASTGGD